MRTLESNVHFVHAGASHSGITLERRVDTVILTQDGQTIQLDEWHVKALREALYELAPRDIP